MDVFHIFKIVQMVPNAQSISYGGVLLGGNI